MDKINLDEMVKDLDKPNLNFMKMHQETFVDVTDTSQVKIKFNASSIDGGEAISGASNYNRTVFTFMKLGDT